MRSDDMKTCEKELILINEGILNCEEELSHLTHKEAFQCGFELIQQVKKPILILIESNSRCTEVIQSCENLIELLIKCGSISFKERPAETVELSAILNYCCFISEEFNLRKEVSDYLNGTYNEWYSVDGN